MLNNNNKLYPRTVLINVISINNDNFCEFGKINIHFQLLVISQPLNKTL